MKVMLYYCLLFETVFSSSSVLSTPLSVFWNTKLVVMKCLNLCRPSNIYSFYQFAMIMLSNIATWSAGLNCVIPWFPGLKLLMREIWCYSDVWISVCELKFSSLFIVFLYAMETFFSGHVYLELWPSVFGCPFLSLDLWDFLLWFYRLLACHS